MPYGPLEEDVQTPSLPGINQGGELDPKIAQLLEIMKLLGNPTAPTPPPQPEPLKKWQNILFGGTGRDFLGSIGDSLAAQSSVLAGGAPPAMGAHAMQVRQRQMDQMKLMEDYKSQVERQNSDQENFKRQIALQFMQGQNQMDVANIRATQPTRASRLQRSEFVRDVNGQPRRFRQFTDPFDGSIQPVVDPNTGELTNELDLGPAYIPPFIQPAVPGVSPPIRVPRVGASGPVADGVTPPPPPNIVNALAMDKASLEAIGMMENAYHEIRAKTAGQSLIGKVARGFVGETKYGGAFKQTEDYANYASTMRNSLNAYIKAQTGAQFSVVEMDRYTALYPEPWDPESLAAKKIENLKQRALADMTEKLRNYPAASEPMSSSDPVEDALREWEASRANPTQ